MLHNSGKAHDLRISRCTYKWKSIRAHICFSEKKQVTPSALVYDAIYDTFLASFLPP